MKPTRCQIVVRGGRDLLNEPSNNPDAPLSRGQDIAVIAIVNGDRVTLPVTGFILRCDGRKAVATVNLIVDSIELTGIECVDGVHVRRIEEEPK